MVQLVSQLQGRLTQAAISCCQIALAIYRFHAQVPFPGVKNFVEFNIKEIRGGKFAVPAGMTTPLSLSRAS